MHSFRPRISISTALLLMTIVALTLAVAQAWREVGPLQIRIRALENETGYLAVEDPSKIYALAVHNVADDSNTWKWRVHLPPDRKYLLHMTAAKLDHQNVPNIADSTFWLESGDLVIEAAAVKDQDGNWILRNAIEHRNPDGSQGDRSSSSVNLGPDAPWANGNTISSGIGQSDGPLDPEKRLELLRVRANDPTMAKRGATTITPKPTNGLLIWIDQRQP